MSQSPAGRIIAAEREKRKKKKKKKAHLLFVCHAADISIRAAAPKISTGKKVTPLDGRLELTRWKFFISCGINMETRHDQMKLKNIKNVG